MHTLHSRYMQSRRGQTLGLSNPIKGIERWSWFIHNIESTCNE